MWVIWISICKLCLNQRPLISWLDIQGFETIAAHAYNMSPADKRTVRRIIFEHFDYIVTEWNKFQEGKNG